MRYLIIESVGLKPHLETAGEIALRLRDEGHDVIFCWVGSNLPWSDWYLPRVAAFIGCSLINRVKKFLTILRQEAIRVVDCPNLETKTINEIYKWASEFEGDIEELKKYKYKITASLGMGSASSLISKHGDGLLSPCIHKNETKQSLIASALVYERVTSLITRVNPDVVITFNGRFATSRPIVVIGDLLGIPVLRHERGSTFERYETFSDAIHNYAYIRKRIAEYWEKTAPEKRAINGNNFFIRRRSGDGIGWYSFTSHQKIGCIPRPNPQKKRIVYFSSSDDEYAAVSDSFQLGPWKNQLDAVKDLISSCSKNSNLELVIRVHPHLAKKSKQEQSRWSRLKSDSVCIVSPKDKVDSYALLDSADIVVSYGSTMGMEAAYWGKPSILLGPCAYANTPPVITIGHQIELSEHLNNLHELQPPNRELCLPYGNYYMSYGELFHYYKPKSLSDGNFLGQRLGWDPHYIYWLRKLGLGKIWRKFFSR